MTDTISRKIVSANILCTILVVCLHARYEYNGVYNIIGTLSDIAVPVFFTISSYLYFEKFDWNNPIASYKKGIKKRVFSLLVPYVIFSSLGFLVFTSKALFEFVLLAPIIGCVVRTTKLSLVLMPLSVCFCYNLSYSNILFWLPVLILGCYCSIWWNSILKVFRDINSLYVSCFGILAIVLICISFYDIIDRTVLVYYIYRISAPVLFLAIIGRFDFAPPPFCLK